MDTWLAVASLHRFVLQRPSVMYALFDLHRDYTEQKKAADPVLEYPGRTKSRVLSHLCAP